jgi:hypothetical protein
VVLIEAGRRRVSFLRHVARQLGLMNLGVEWGRAEALGGGPLAGRFRTVTMRAVAAGSAAEALAAPFLHPEGVLAVSLGPTAAARRGTRRKITLAFPGELPWRREFLIIRSTELDPDVSRGTRRATEPQSISTPRRMPPRDCRPKGAGRRAATRSTRCLRRVGRPPRASVRPAYPGSRSCRGVPIWLG